MGFFANRKKNKLKKFLKNKNCSDSLNEKILTQIEDGTITGEYQISKLVDDETKKKNKPIVNKSKSTPDKSKSSPSKPKHTPSKTVTRKTGNSNLKSFEELNKTTKSIYDLEGNKVLIILDDGTNLTSWDDVQSKSSIKYISEDLSEETSLFSKYDGCGYVEAIVATNVSSKVSTMNRMFMNCARLKTLTGLETWDTKNVKDMEMMFSVCSALEDIDELKYLDTSSVTDMTEMFGACHSLTTLDPLKNWDVSKVDSMEGMFYKCRGLTDISATRSWNKKSNVNDYDMFKGCTNI